MPDRPAILVLVDYYPPALRAGGPTRSVPGIVKLLGGHFLFRVVTRDRDLGSQGRLHGIIANRWTHVDGGDCLYLSRARSWPPSLWWSLRRIHHDALYLNSVFSIPFSFWPALLRRARLLPRVGLLVSPRGELDEGALGLKRRRKQMYLAVLQRLGLLGDAVWHATSFDEAGRVHANFGREARVVIAPAIPMGIPMPAGRPEKEKGRLDLIFLSRISRKKNLGFLIEALRGSRGQINLEVIGPIEDHRYWWECRRAASSLPANVRFRYAGIADPEEVPAVLEQHHLFVLPTLGENFGHAIVESLLSGCPVLISDQTPWRNLEARRAGWDLSLSDPQGFCRAIERCVDMDARQFDEWSVGARQLGLEIAEQPESVDSYISLFQMALSPDTAR